MSYIKGKNVRVEIAATYGAGKTVSAITKASPGVATSTAHGLADSSVGYLSGLSGMVELEGQAVRVDAPATDTISLEEIDTTSYGTFTGTCSFVPVATWLTLAPATNYEISGGEADKLDTTVLLDRKKQEETGLLGAETVSIGLRAEDTLGAAVRLLRQQAKAAGSVLFRITLSNGAQRIFRGEPSLPSESVSSGQLGSGAMTVTVKGDVLFLN